MKSLFLRIFISFWAAQALFIIFAILITIAFNRTPRGIEAQGQEVIAETVNAYQTGGETAARNYLETVRNNERVRAFVFDEHGRELGGRHAPPWIEDARRNVPFHHGW